MLESIESVLPIDRSGSVVLEEILINKNPSVAGLGSIGYKEAIVVGSWYIWWQRREKVKGEQVKDPARSAFAILGLTANYQGAKQSAEIVKRPSERPPHNTYKLNIDAAFFPNGT